MGYALDVQNTELVCWDVLAMSTGLRMIGLDYFQHVHPRRCTLMPWYVMCATS